MAKRTTTSIFIFLFNYYELHAHVADFHLPSVEEWMMEEKVERERKCNKYFNTLHDTEASEEEREAAMYHLYELGGIS